MGTFSVMIVIVFQCLTPDSCAQVLAQEYLPRAALGMLLTLLLSVRLRLQIPCPLAPQWPQSRCVRRGLRLLRITNFFQRQLPQFLNYVPSPVHHPYAPPFSYL